MPELPRQIRLAAGDYFMHGQDRRMRRVGLKGNVCHAVLRLGPGLDVERLRRHIAASPILDWLARVRIRRPLPVVAPFWRAAANPPQIFYEYDDQCPRQEGPALLPPGMPEQELLASRGPAFALSLTRHPDKSSHLVLSWNHSLMDARGADLVLHHVGSDNTANGAPTLEDLINPKQRGLNLNPAAWWRNARSAHGSVDWLRTSGSEPLFSLMPSLRPASPCRNSYRVLPFSKEETARIDARCQKLNATFRRSHFYLAASLRGLHAVAVARGDRTGAYLIPVPHDMRRRGGNGPIFSNHLSILFYRIEPKLVASLSGVIAELTRQMTEQIRTRFPECCMAALNMFKPLPLDYYVHHLGKPTRGKFATLCFSDSGETCAGMTQVFGAPLEAVTHLVPSWRPPGLTVLFLTFDRRLTGLLSWVDDCLSTAEVDVMERSLRAALLEDELT
jgi:hypothetical protein